MVSRPPTFLCPVDGCDRQAWPGVIAGTPQVVSEVGTILLARCDCPRISDNCWPRVIYLTIKYGCIHMNVATTTVYSIKKAPLLQRWCVRLRCFCGVYDASITTNCDIYTLININKRRIQRRRMPTKGILQICRSDDCCDQVGLSAT